jgi:ATP-dependent DNA helicase DinG
MRCPKCAILIPYNKAPDLENCAVCGSKFTPQVRDVLEFGKFGIAKEVRPTQIALGQDVEEILHTKAGGVLLAEGGTGIGKSFAYLIPALLAEDKRVVIATAKKTLQDQLAEKDVPFLIEKMKRPVKFSLYKGKSNYGCWKLAKAVPPEDREKYNRFVAQARVDGHPADIAKWRGQRPWWWPRVSVDNCMLKRCEFAGQCKPAPKNDDVVITNHHLLALDMRLGPGSLLGPYNLLIIDEAHQAPEAYRSAYSHEVTFKGLDRLRSSFKKDDMLRGIIDDLGNTTVKQLNQKLDDLKKSFEDLHKQARRASDDAGKVRPEQLEDVLDTFAANASFLHKKNVADMGELKEYLDDSFNGNVELSDVYSTDEFMVILSRMLNRGKKYERLISFAEQVQSSVSAGSATSYITTMDERGLKVQPLNIGDFIGPNLRTVSHKVIMSATLAMGNDFSYSKNLFGIGKKEGLTEEQSKEKVVEKIYSSPFDLDKQAVMYLPRHLELPAHQGLPDRRVRWISDVANEIAQLVGATNGDAFVLFSAKADMNEVLAELGPHVWTNLGLNLIVQDGEATAALDEYKETPGSVLFGLKSFWEGVDIAGDRLKLVIIPKLPFPNPKDPIVSALCEVAGRNSFMEVMVPRMVFDMKQGVGRLIRTQSDRGFVAILDVRVWTGTSNEGTHAKRMKTIDLDTQKKRMGYGKKLLDTLGYRKVTDDFTILQTFVNRFFKAS